MHLITLKVCIIEVDYTNIWENLFFLIYIYEMKWNVMWLASSTQMQTWKELLLKVAYYHNSSFNRKY